MMVFVFVTASKPMRFFRSGDRVFARHKEGDTVLLFKSSIPAD
jgi:hypothetical protein